MKVIGTGSDWDGQWLGRAVIGTGSDWDGQWLGRADGQTVQTDENNFYFQLVILVIYEKSYHWCLLYIIIFSLIACWPEQTSEKKFRHWKYDKI